MKNSYDPETLADELIALGRDELAKRLRKIEADALEALRRLVHPESHEPMQVKGVEARHPPRHESGSIRD